MTLIREALRDALRDALDRGLAAGELTAADGAPLPSVSIERPGRAEHGDYASNLAMRLAPVMRRAPMQIAEALRRNLVPPPAVSGVTVAAPGFVNLRLDDAWVAEQIGPILAAGERYGRGSDLDGHHVNVEFVSANPTGPLTLGNARGAFVGDLLSRVLEGAGAAVTREYYFNDQGPQVRNLGRSVLAIVAGEPVPDDGYHGAYVADLAADLPEDVLQASRADDADPAWAVGVWASERVRAAIEGSLARLGVRFDAWTTEGSLHRDGWVSGALERLQDAGHLYQAEGATWFRSTAFGDDKDRVVIRSNGQPTYFAADIGYLEHKFKRGFTELIYLWGADHHGTVARNRAAAEALGHQSASIHWLLIAWVRFVRDGREISMSKRSGEFVTLDELLSEIGTDAARWFFGSRATSTGIDFDIELAKRQSSENPVYYVQYAHARCASILRNAGSARPDARQAGELLRQPAEQALARELLRLPEVVSDSAQRRETHDIPRYGLDVAALFSQFYRDCRVLTDDAPLSAARLALVDATRLVLANALGLLGITAPSSM
ncbi:MAG: arginine--tRNA ligase [Chloroflexota bacterium]|nr:arginine--tRNA ligase [Chloroflexota bacterium]